MEASTSTVVQVALVLVVGIVASGCANYSFVAFRRPVTQSESLTTADAQPPLRSDRLRDRYTQTLPPGPTGQDRPATETPAPTRIPAPTRPQEPAQPQQPARPSEPSPRPSRNEPDPRDVIDWILKR